MKEDNPLLNFQRPLRLFHYHQRIHAAYDFCDGPGKRPAGLIAGKSNGFRKGCLKHHESGGAYGHPAGNHF